MSVRSNWYTWTPRILAILLAAFLSLFALDALEGDASAMRKFGALLMHLVPTWICIAALVIAWRREWLGALIFLAMAAGYTWWAWGHAQWILAIAGPLLLVAISYGLAWVKRARTTSTA